MTQNKHASQLKYLDAKKRIKKQIDDGRFEGKLPGERLLADQIGYSYLTIRQAINELVEEGFLYRQPRRGTFISSTHRKVDRRTMVGFFLHTSHKHGISSPYYAKVFNSLQKHVTRQRCNLFYFTDIGQIDPRAVSAVIAAAFPESQEALIRLNESVPVILFDNNIKGVKIPAVVIDNFNATYHAVEHALELGHRTIGYVSGPKASSVGRKRLAGYKTALRDYDIEPEDIMICYGDYEFDAGMAAADYFGNLPAMPSFIHCANDLMAMGLIKGLSEKGVRIPADVSVSGFDDIDGCDRYVPSLTTMAVDYDKMAETVVEIILQRLQRQPLEIPEIIIPATLIVRESTCPYRP